MKKNSAITIILEDMQVDVRIGVYDHEQQRAQRIVVNVELEVDPSEYLDNPTMESVVDYDFLHDGIKGWAERPHVLLIESYLSELLSLCFSHECVMGARVRISKPDIYDDVERVGVEAFMTREEWAKA